MSIKWTKTSDELPPLKEPLVVVTASGDITGALFHESGGRRFVGAVGWCGHDLEPDWFDDPNDPCRGITHWVLAKDLERP